MDKFVMKCPYCKEKLPDVTVPYGYGSPIRICKSCGIKYADRRYSEPAIDGIDTRLSSVGICVWGTVLFSIVFIGQLLWFYLSKAPFGYDTKSQIGILILSGGMIPGCIGRIIYIKLGYADRACRRLLTESERRLQDPEYVKELLAFGIYVPQKYIKKEK